MKRYEFSEPRENEFEPSSQNTVLRNRKGIVDPALMDRLEASLLALAQARSYRQIETETSISFQLVRDLHRSWLKSVYDFAGEIRTVDLAKGSVRFAPLAYMETSLLQLDKLLLECTPCKGMDLETLTSSIARVHTELVLVHPFREGNGRLSRWVADIMALQAGFPQLEWGFDWDPEARRDRYFNALRRGFAMDFGPLEKLVKEALELAVHLAASQTSEA